MKVQNIHKNHSSITSSNKLTVTIKNGILGIWKSIKYVFSKIKNPFKLYQQTSYKLRKILKIVWPINWQKLFNLSLIWDSIYYATKKLKIIVGVLFVCLMISLISLLGSFFNLLMVEAGDNKGTFNEAVFGQTISKINPVITANSEAEKKIIDLIYQPLYRLDYPNFLTSKDKPRIIPILLESEPTWASDNKTLKLVLKKDLKWSDGSKLEANDVVYSFNKIKEVNGNAEYRDVYSNYKLIAISNLELELTQISSAKAFNPQIKFLLNFYPISQKYFEDKNTDEIATSPKAFLNQVSSGQFTLPTKVKIEGKEVQNPTKDVTGTYSSLVLERNKNNLIQPTLVDRYIIRVYNDLIDVGGNSGANSVERASINKKVDLFARQINPENKLSEIEIKNKLKLEQTIVPTNTYYIMYANLQSNQWLINSLLRKYVLCSLSEISPQPNQTNLAKIPNNKAFLPMQFQDNFEANCSTARNEMLSQVKNGANPYTESENKILVENEQVDLNILTLQELTPSMKGIQEQLARAGIKSSVITTKDTNELDRKISEKNYNLVYLPTTIISNDPYPMYGAKSRNISSINKSNRIGNSQNNFGEGIEKLLKDYSESNLENLDLQTNVKDFFKSEFVSLNMFSSNLEVNYSPRINIQKTEKDKNNQNKNLFGNSITFSYNLYQNLPNIFVETKKKFFWE